MAGPDPLADQHPPGSAADHHITTGGQGQQLPPVREEPQQLQPPFQPLFTLVTDSATHATHHPEVHYIFSDDDPEILTEALARHGHQSSPVTSAERASAPQAPPNERAIVLDLVSKSADNSHSPQSTLGYDVAWVSSLSPSWAVVTAKTSTMTEENSNNVTTLENETGAGPRLVLRIEGVPDNAVSSTPTTSQIPGTRARRTSPDERDLRMSASSHSVAAQEKAREDYGAIVDEFDKRMNILRKVVDAGLERQRSAPGPRVANDELPAGVAAHNWTREPLPDYGQEHSVRHQGEQRSPAT